MSDKPIRLTVCAVSVPNFLQRYCSRASLYPDCMIGACRQVVAARPLLLNLKDKAQCVVVGRRRSDGSVSVVLAEPFCLYKLPDGEWSSSGVNVLTPP